MDYMNRSLLERHGSVFPFLSLPAELRNEVYRLTHPPVIDTAKYGKTLIPLTETSHRIREEYLASLIHHALFTIDFTQSGNYGKFLEWIFSFRPQDLAKVRHIRMISSMRVHGRGYLMSSHPCRMIIPTSLHGHGRLMCSRPFCFEFHANPHSPNFNITCHMTKQRCRDDICTEPFEILGDPPSMHVSIPFKVEEVSYGTLTVEHLMAWANNAMASASRILEYDGDPSFLPCWDCGKNVPCY